MSAARCNAFSSDVVGLLEGTADESLRAHVATCDACRDAAHGIEQLAARVARAGDDFTVTPPLAERLARIAEEAARETGPQTPRAAASSDGERISATRLRTEPPAASSTKKSEPRKSKKALWLLLAACASIGVSAIVGVKLADHQRSPGVAATRAWHGKVAKVARSGADAAGEPGLSVVTPSGKTPLAEGAEIKAGMHVATDGRTRARLWLDDGTTVVLDRATEIAVESAPRTISVVDGAVLADVAHVDGAPWAKVKTPNGDVKVLGTKFAVTALADRTNVEVLRGEVEVIAGDGSQKVSAGQEGVVGKDGKIDIAPANDLAQRAAFGEQLLSTHNEDAEAPASGLGELRAKRPGRADEKDHAVRLERHAVKVRIAGNVARTEIDETFGNDTDDELEGIYRFPLPPGAQIERLALEVDGKLLDGEFIDKAKASAIWRGAIQNAAPKAPKPREEIVWVPGPWHDPALLEWKRGGRFELRIFPIPKRGSRRVVIAYTETVAPVSGVRRYVYPLPQGSSSRIAIDQFSVDAQVLGHAASVPVRVRGYELDKKDEGGAVRLTSTMTSFAPSGDLAIEYGLDDKKTDATVWAYRAESGAPAPAAAEPAGVRPSAKASKDEDLVGTDPFVAIALRPKLPRWSESKPRDQVIVVDAGRTMYGERFARAKRLAVQMTQEMDRRDRVTVIACDVSCKALPGGFVAPGAPSAHDVDAFLGGVTPDGASDLVGAVRAASKLAGHEEGRDLRVALLSDGVATAGYRSAARVSAEIADAALGARSLVVAVPIGADADVNLLSDIARGGGGVVVPYQPGQRLEATAIEVLNATYGTTLRDVEVILPEGLRDRAPAAVAPLRAGAETIVTARMSGDFVKGDIVLRGKVGGDAFEAKYPIEVRATTDAGNAFVPRLFAAARVADREREPGDGAHAELVALSRRFAVPSRTTSLLVLESEAMFKAFGIERAAHGPKWTGEALAQGALVASNTAGDPSAAAGALTKALVGDEEASTSGFGELAEAKKDKDSTGLGSVGTLGHGKGGGGSAPRDLSGALGNAAGKPAPTAAPAQPASPPPPAKAAQRAERFDDAAEPFTEQSRRRPPNGFGGRFMKKVFVRRATLTADASPGVAADKLAQARAAVAAAPDEREKHKDLARMLALSGQLDELGETLEKWSSRDPLDVDVIVGRADVAARRGDRDASLRILGGALAASALTPADAFTVAQAVGRSHDRLGKAEGCAFHVAAAELRSTDPDALARAISCERAQGRPASAERWFVGLKETQRSAVNAAIVKLDAQRSEGTFGDVVVSASWSGGADLDVALVDPSGRRAGAVSRLKNARVEGATSRDRETVALSSNEAGSFLVEVVRTSASDSAASAVPVSGTVTLKAFGQTRSIPFTLSGARVQVGRVDVRWEAELVPVDDVPVFAPPPVVGGGPFDRAAAASALERVGVQHCASSGQVGTGHATVTFGPTGRVSEVVIDDANFSGTPAGRCVQTAFFNASVPSFTGGPVRVGKSFTLGAPLAR
ncbi:MAG: FecR domain-containing protein [Labilithrix sp.]|nr:FecR domain-containing protein [Labilithrix sp.]